MLLTPIGTHFQLCRVPLHNPYLPLEQASEGDVPVDGDGYSTVDLCEQRAVGHLTSTGTEIAVCASHAVMAVGYQRTREVCLVNAEQYRAAQRQNHSRKNQHQGFILGDHPPMLPGMEIAR